MRRSMLVLSALLNSVASPAAASDSDFTPASVPMEKVIKIVKGRKMFSYYDVIGDKELPICIFRR